MRRNTTDQWMTPDDWTATQVAAALVDLLEEPFATSEDVGLDVRRVEVVAPAGAPVSSRRGVETVEFDLACGATFRLAVERLG